MDIGSITAVHTTYRVQAYDTNYQTVGAEDPQRDGGEWLPLRESARSGGVRIRIVHDRVLGVRTYERYVPSGYDGCPVPLVVMLHGCGQTPSTYAAATRMNGPRRARKFSRDLPRSDGPREPRSVLGVVRT
ncbi:hypothetical protein BRC86_02230 [Halobacteriales archaeon QS_3_64_16]|nr:MAG: hypothetical protein BRC86_02230 [Halobacteriales archaeon QS_3_64_16]